MQGPSFVPSTALRQRIAVYGSEPLDVEALQKPETKQLSLEMPRGAVRHAMAFDFAIPGFAWIGLDALNDAGEVIPQRPLRLLLVRIGEEVPSNLRLEYLMLLTLGEAPPMVVYQVHDSSF